jgi:hypothetical protein
MKHCWPNPITYLGDQAELSCGNHACRRCSVERNKHGLSIWNKYFEPKGYKCFASILCVMVVLKYMLAHDP